MRKLKNNIKILQKNGKIKKIIYLHNFYFFFFNSTIVQQDKMTLQENMDQLDEKKKDALKRCYMVVN